MSVNHSESQQSIRSLSNSISSLASQMSQLLNISNTLDPKQKGPLLRQLEVLPSSDIAELEDEWCCDALSGIDDGFVEDGDHHDRCIFCSFTNFRGGLDSSHEKGRHLVETHSFGKCNLMITYSTWEALDMHLLYFHNSRLYESRVGEPPLLIRFRRKERVRPFFRDVENDSDHPSNIIERATEGLIIKDRLRIALNELYSDESCKCRPYAQIPLLRSDFRMEEPFPNQRYKIACLLEELIVSDNEQYLECFLGPWPILTPETSAFMKDRFEERSIINAWLLKILGESLSLRVLLLCGKAFPVVHPAIPSNWLFPILSFWDADEAATGFEQIHQPSDGAVDSRDDLKSRATSSVELELPKQQLDDDIELHQASDPDIPRVPMSPLEITPHIPCVPDRPDTLPPKKDNGEAFADHTEDTLQKLQNLEHDPTIVQKFLAKSTEPA